MIHVPSIALCRRRWRIPLAVPGKLLASVSQKVTRGCVVGVVASPAVLGAGGESRETRVRSVHELDPDIEGEPDTVGEMAERGKLGAEELRGTLNVRLFLRCRHMLSADPLVGVIAAESRRLSAGVRREALVEMESREALKDSDLRNCDN